MLCTNILLFLFSAAAVVVIQTGANTTSTDPVTYIGSGVFRGAWNTTRRGRRFQSYRGIRYAEPPVGELRFQPPKPILTYGEVDATQDGPACPQPAPAGYLVDEDCLVLNVYTPERNSSGLLPVIIFMHPGGFYSMSGRNDLYGAHYMMDKDVVLVTFNYRLGSLGFLALGNKLAPGNNGYKDQVVVLKWVQKNIAAFGGDPNLVTLTGDSAGGVSVMLHMISPMSRGLFHRAISMSGSPTAKVPAPTSRMDLALKQARYSKCPEEPEALYHCLKTKPWKEIAGTLLSFFEFGYDPLSLWRPVIEPDFGQERFLSEDPMYSIRMGHMKSVPFIITTTTDEFFWKKFTILKNHTLTSTMNSEWARIAPISFSLPREETPARMQLLRDAYFHGRPVSNDTGDALGKLYSDAITGFPVHRMANLMCRHSAHPVYYGQFAYIGNHSRYQDPVTKKPVGVSHHDDTLYLFTLHYYYPTIQPGNSGDSDMVDKMTALWYNFAKYGNPNPVPHDATPTTIPGNVWPPMNPNQRTYLRIDSTFSTHENLNEDRYKVWEGLYPIQYE